MKKQNIITITGLSPQYNKESILEALKAHGPKTVLIKGNIAFVQFTEPSSDKLDLLDIQYDDRRIQQLGNAKYHQFDQSLYELPNPVTEISMDQKQDTQAINISSGGFILQQKKEHNQSQNQQFIRQQFNQANFEEELRKEQQDKKHKQQLQKIQKEKQIERQLLQKQRRLQQQMKRQAVQAQRRQIQMAERLQAQRIQIQNQLLREKQQRQQAQKKRREIQQQRKRQQERKIAQRMEMQRLALQNELKFAQQQKQIAQQQQAERIRRQNNQKQMQQQERLLAMQMEEAQRLKKLDQQMKAKQWVEKELQRQAQIAETKFKSLDLSGLGKQAQNIANKWSIKPNYERPVSQSKNSNGYLMVMVLAVWAIFILMQ